MSALRRLISLLMAAALGSAVCAPSPAAAAPTPVGGNRSATSAPVLPAPVGGSTAPLPALVGAAAVAPAFDDLSSTLTIPSVAGVEFLVDGEVKPAGPMTYTVPFRGTKVTVTARSTTGGPAPVPSSWTHLFPEVVEMPAPKFEDVGLRVQAPSRLGVQLFAEGIAGPLRAGSWNDLSQFEGRTVRVYAKAPVPSQTLLVGVTEWTHRFPARAAVPTFDDPSSTITIPSATGVEYLVDGVVAPAGPLTLQVPFRGKRVTVTVRSTTGGPAPVPSSWTHLFPEVVTPDAPVFDEGMLRVWVPSHNGVQFFAEGRDKPLVSNSWNSLAEFTGKTVRIHATTPYPAVTLITGTTKWDHTFAARPAYSIATGDEFNGDALAQAWNVPSETKPSKGKSVYRHENVTVHDGVLDVRIRRHCVANADELVSDANKTEAVCPAGTITRYSTGRLNTGFIYGAPKTMEVRAKLDPEHHGITSTAWMHNDEPFCNGSTVTNSDLAEFDVMEIWATDYSQSFSHITCENNRYHTVGVKTVKHIPGDWHTWRLEWDGVALKYYLDGELQYGPHGAEVTATSLRLTQEKFQQVINENLWQIVINVNTPPDGNWAPWINDTEPFRERHDLYDYVRIEEFIPRDCAPGGEIGRLRATRPDLGQAQSCEVDGAVPGSRLQVFDNGRIYWAPTTGARAVTGPILDRFIASGGDRALGLPIAESLPLRDGGLSQRFERGTIFQSPAAVAHVVRGAILDKYGALGWESSPLGYPISDEFCGLRDGGCVQRFERADGHIYWSRGSGAHFMRGAIFAQYREMGWENSEFGYPTSDEICGLRDGGCVQRFQHTSGHIYWTSASGAHFMRGEVFKRYAAMGWENSAFGYPITDEICGIRGGGCFQRFQGERGHLYWSAGSGAWGVQGMIFAHYEANRWETGRFGYAVGPERCADVAGVRECTQRFQGGQIVWNSRTGARG